ncbi:ribonuclease Y [Planctomyces sp. SH-PL14]|uniref:ribonuclease Y n=1 Tax=Planctomyces sp. SH-PL14 TaxID=1632864 RepID=UPI00078DB510|nr:ribonuclease Y [Planctomyces sp. SH-PL14]AMV16856.1 Ribonuclease Y [Planctomyces sp. SH-PL14]
MGYVAAALAGIAAGALVGFFMDRLRMGAAYRTRDQLMDSAKTDADNFRKEKELEIKEQLLKRREDLENELRKVRNELHEQERRIDKRESDVNQLQNEFSKKEKMLQTQQNRLVERTKVIETQERELDRMVKQEQEELYKISGLNREQAAERLMTRLDGDLNAEAGRVIMRKESELKQNSEKLAREIIGMAVQRYASAHTSETTVSTIDIPSDEVKGRIIGREGRNIRAFEKETGVDVIVDDTPGVVVVSCFDTVRREIAKRSLAKLIQDGRIHPAKIEEVVRETQKEMDDTIMRLGKEAAEEADVPGAHPKLIALMGRLNFRVSYSQNVLRHSIEVAHLTGMMAEQLGMDGTMGRRCGFFHDIGKAADHEAEGGHPAIGADLLKRYNEGPEVVHAALGHHDDIRPDFLYTVLTAAADACSASRPGSRRETLEKYIKRLEELEALVCGFPGVSQVYAVQAGREVRVIVDPKAVNDREAAKMARDISIAVEQNLTYPGEVKVVVMRETRAVGVAK